MMKYCTKNEPQTKDLMAAIANVEHLLPTNGIVIVGKGECASVDQRNAIARWVEEWDIIHDLSGAIPMVEDETDDYPLDSFDDDDYLDDDSSDDDADEANDDEEENDRECALWMTLLKK